MEASNILPLVGKLKVDSGDGVTHLIPISEGYIQQNLVIRIFFWQPCTCGPGSTSVERSCKGRSLRFVDRFRLTGDIQREMMLPLEGPLNCFH